MHTLKDFIEITAPKTENIIENYTNIRINSRGLISIDNNYCIIDDNGNKLFTIPFRITISKQLKLNVMQLNCKDYKAYYQYKIHGIKNKLMQVYSGWLYEYQDDLMQFF